MTTRAERIEEAARELLKAHAPSPGGGFNYGPALSALRSALASPPEAAGAAYTEAGCQMRRTEVELNGTPSPSPRPCACTDAGPCSYHEEFPSPPPPSPKESKP